MPDFLNFRLAQFRCQICHLILSFPSASLMILFPISRYSSFFYGWAFKQSYSHSHSVTLLDPHLFMFAFYQSSICSAVYTLPKFSAIVTTSLLLSFLSNHATSAFSPALLEARFCFQMLDHFSLSTITVILIFLLDTLSFSIIAHFHPHSLLTSHFCAHH